MPTASCRPPATSRRSARREGRGSAIRMATSSGYARGLDRTLGQLAESSKRLALPSTAEWRQDHSEHHASAIALEQKLSLMPTPDKLTYEECDTHSGSPSLVIQAKVNGSIDGARNGSGALRSSC